MTGSVLPEPHVAMANRECKHAGGVWRNRCRPLGLASYRRAEHDQPAHVVAAPQRDQTLPVGLQMFRPRPLWFLEPLLRREVDQPLFPLANRNHGDHKHLVMHLIYEAKT